MAKQKRKYNFEEIAVKVDEAISRHNFSKITISKYCGFSYKVLTRYSVLYNRPIDFNSLFYPVLIKELQESDLNIRQIALKYQVKLGDINQLLKKRSIRLKDNQLSRTSPKDRSYIMSISDEIAIAIAIEKGMRNGDLLLKFGITQAELDGFVYNKNLFITPERQYTPKERYIGFPNRFVIKGGAFYHSEKPMQVGDRFYPNDYLIRN